MNKIKKIGILTSGGDAPGMNAVINTVIKLCAKKGFKTIGVKHGFRGLINNCLVPMNVENVSGIVNRGGTILYSARCLEMKTKEGFNQAVNTCKNNEIDGLIVVGGDGSFCGAQLLSNAGISCVGIPGTIDNDIACTDYSLGYDTAVNTAVQMVDRLRDTITSHDRCSVVEVMGRNAGYIALDVALSCGANYVVVPEVNFDEQNLINKMKNDLKNGKKHFIIVVAECILNAHNLAKTIELETKVETRATILGHVQRGGNPTVNDRLLGAKFGEYAVKLLVNGKSNRVVGVKNGTIVDFEINEALKMKKEFPIEVYKLAMEIA